MGHTTFAKLSEEHCAFKQKRIAGEDNCNAIHSLKLPLTSRKCELGSARLSAGLDDCPVNSAIRCLQDGMPAAAISRIYLYFEDYHSEARVYSNYMTVFKSQISDLCKLQH